MSEKQHAPCPFCGGTDLMPIHGPHCGDVKAWIVCRNEQCYAHGPKRIEVAEAGAIAAAWEAWDAASGDKMRDAIVALALDIENYDTEDLDLCRYAEHMQGLCGCRDLAAALRSVADSIGK